MRMDVLKRAVFCFALMFFVGGVGGVGEVFAAEGEGGAVYVGERDLQTVIDAAADYAEVVCDRGRRVTISQTVVIRKPLTLRGLNAQLPEGLGETPILEVVAAGVSITDFELHGNAATVSQDNRSALISIHAGDFRVERGLFVDSSKDGLEVTTEPGKGPSAGDIVGGIVRDIVGRGVVRDVVSISGSNLNDGRKVRNVLVDNIRGYDSQLRGVVEVSDGAENVTVRKVYAERCVYGVDVQDHGEEKQVNRHVLIEDLYAVDCKHALRTANRPFAHSGLVIRDVVAERCTEPLLIKHTRGVRLEGVRVLEHPAGEAAVVVERCAGVVIRDVTVSGDGGGDEKAKRQSALQILNSSDVTIQGVRLEEGTGGAAVTYRITKDMALANLRIEGVVARGLDGAGIVLENTRKQGGTLRDYVVWGNATKVRDDIEGVGGRVFGNDRGADGSIGN